MIVIYVCLGLVNNNIMRNVPLNPQIMFNEELLFDVPQLDNLEKARPIIFMDMETSPVDVFYLKFLPDALLGDYNTDIQVDIYLYAQFHYKSKYTRVCSHNISVTTQDLYLNCDYPFTRNVVVDIYSYNESATTITLQENITRTTLVEVSGFFREWKEMDISIGWNYPYKDMFIYPEGVYSDILKTNGNYLQVSGAVYWNETVPESARFIARFKPNITSFDNMYVVYNESYDWFVNNSVFMFTNYHTGRYYGIHFTMETNDGTRYFIYVNDISVRIQTKHTSRPENMASFYVHTLPDVGDNENHFLFKHDDYIDICAKPYIPSLRRQAALSRFITDLNPWHRSIFDKVGAWIGAARYKDINFESYTWYSSLDNNIDMYTPFTNRWGESLKTKFSYFSNISDNYRKPGLDLRNSLYGGYYKSFVNYCVYIDNSLKWKVSRCNQRRMLFCQIDHVMVDIWSGKTTNFFQSVPNILPLYSYSDMAVDYDMSKNYYFNPFPVNFDVLRLNEYIQHDTKDISVMFTFYQSNTHSSKYSISCDECVLVITSELKHVYNSGIIRGNKKILVESLPGISKYELRVYCTEYQCPVYLYRLRHGLWDFPTEYTLSFHSNTEEIIHYPEAQKFMGLPNEGSILLSLLVELVTKPNYLASWIFNSYNTQRCLCPDRTYAFDRCIYDPAYMSNKMFNSFICLRMLNGVESNDGFVCDMDIFEDRNCAATIFSLFQGISKVNNFNYFKYKIKTPHPFYIDHQNRTLRLPLSFVQHAIMTNINIDLSFGINESTKNELVSKLCPNGNSANNVWDEHLMYDYYNLSEFKLNCTNHFKTHRELHKCEHIIGYMCCKGDRNNECPVNFKPFVIENRSFWLSDQFLSQIVDDIICIPDSKSYNHISDRYVNDWDYETCRILQMIEPDEPFIPSEEELDYSRYADKNMSIEIDSGGEWKEEHIYTCDQLRFEIIQLASANQLGIPANELSQFKYCNSECLPCNRFNERGYGGTVMNSHVMNSPSGICGYNPFTGKESPQTCGLRGCSTEYVREHYDEWKSILIVNSTGHVQQAIGYNCDQAYNKFKDPCPVRVNDQVCLEKTQEAELDHTWQKTLCMLPKNYVASIEFCEDKTSSQIYGNYELGFSEEQMIKWTQDNNALLNCMATNIEGSHGAFINDNLLSEIANPARCPYNKYDTKVQDECDITQARMSRRQHCCFSENTEKCSTYYMYWTGVRFKKIYGLEEVELFMCTPDANQENKEYLFKKDDSIHNMEDYTSYTILPTALPT
jgi:hypothetical protein